MIGLGIDTGGTCTDAVLYDLDQKEVLWKNKTLTTKSHLERGIGKVLEGISQNDLKKAEFLALSTTLATNACVEGIAGKCQLVFIHVRRETVAEQYTRYGLPSPEEIYFLSPDDRTEEEPDWEQFKRDLPQLTKENECLAVVSLDARKNMGAYERTAQELVKQVSEIPCICGNDLFSDLNVLRRGATALLNAGLIPVIDRFLKAVDQVLESRGVQMPVVIVRSDGSLMSRSFTAKHPVETLLCGPAASVMGGVSQSEAADAILVDMGGTTTDVAIVRDHFPLRVTTGIQIGAWKTFVKGLFIDTFGLGGDSAVRFRDGELYLDTRRVVPLCMLAADYPEVKEKLQQLTLTQVTPHTYGLHEFLILLKEEPLNPALYSDTERALCEQLQAGPLMLSEAAASVGKDVYSLKTEHLEQEGILMRAGLTPTDIMHLEGQYQAYDTEVSRMAAAFVGLCVHVEDEETFCKKVHALIVKKMYCGIARILLQNQDSYFRDGVGEDIVKRLVEDSYRCALKGDSFCGVNITTSAVLVGLGAPIHLYLREVAALFGTTAFIPKVSAVANALGAVVGNVSVTYDVLIQAIYELEGLVGYRVLDRHHEPKDFEKYEDAKDYARSLAGMGATLEMKERGSESGFSVELVDHEAVAPQVCGSSMYLEETVTARAIGRMAF